MGNCEETKACKPEKSASPPPPSEHPQTGVHAYPDWATVQAYYGPRMAMPPYYNSAVASGHAPPPYMWGPPQHMMPPPYAAMYPHGGVYPHPGVPILMQASPVCVDSPAKSSGNNSDRGLMKKLKGFDGLAMSIGNGNDIGISHSGETEGSSEGSDGNTTEGGQNNRKRSSEGSPHAPEIGKTGPLNGQVFPAEPNEATKKPIAITVTPYKDTELKKSPTVVASATLSMMPSEVLLQNEQELKKERRKQSNRESARRSRLRKQAEAEELSIKVEALTNENLNLKSEINRLTDTSEKLKLQNSKLMEKLKTAQQEHDTEYLRPDPKGLSLSTANLLSRVNNGSSSPSGGEGEMYESNNNKKSGAKLRQLLDASPRTDAVAAG